MGYAVDNAKDIEGEDTRQHRVEGTRANTQSQHPILQLQQQAGNQAVLSAMRSSAPIANADLPFNGGLAFHPTFGAGSDSQITPDANQTTPVFFDSDRPWFVFAQQSPDVAALHYALYGDQDVQLTETVVTTYIGFVPIEQRGYIVVPERLLPAQERAIRHFSNMNDLRLIHSLRPT